MDKYLIVNMDRKFWTGNKWAVNIKEAKAYEELAEARGIAEPLVFKSYVVSNYGRFDEKEEYRNFGWCGRSITWGRYDNDL